MNESAPSANDNRATTVTSGRRAMHASPQDEARGLEVVRLHQRLEDWRDCRRLSVAERWPALAYEIICIEIRTLERAIARQVRELF
ncbi:hypothetical protein [Methylosinus sp. PW1]|uniref:hypothetical protein n=1 Tax=Methylosinus sp. PW1 TaxID=107636 RepID=UPI001AEC631E|nr:hypothetical protein [Methylosinus sp. PW1]